MKKLRKILSAIVLTAMVAFAAGCTPEDDPSNGGNNNGGNNNGGNDNSPVQVTTVTPSNLTSRTALCGVKVTLGDGHPEIDEIGVCWSRNWNPKANVNHLCTDVCNQPFSCTIASLRPNTEYHVRAYALAGEDYYYGEELTFTTLASGGIHNDPEFVDLGLPSGTLWATFNVGANFPEEPGDYYAWGETEIKEYYKSENYQYGQYNALTKYCPGPEFGLNGYFDQLTSLEPADDAATVNWGSEWCTPTLFQWKEMVNTTTNEWTTVNGMCERLYTASNGNSIFLPAAGAHHETNDPSGIGRNGNYWTKDIFIYDPNFADDVWFSEENWFHGTSPAYETGESRYLGYSIRPVRVAN